MKNISLSKLTHYIRRNHTISQKKRQSKKTWQGNRTKFESLKREGVTMKWRFRNPLPKYGLIKTIFEVQENKERVSLTLTGMIQSTPSQLIKNLH